MANEFDIEDFDEDDLEDAMEGLDLEDQFELLIRACNQVDWSREPHRVRGEEVMENRND